VEWLQDLAQTMLGWLEGFTQTPNNPVGLLIILGSALVEYVFPPFPGDLVTLFGAILVGKWGWSFPLVFGAVTIGSAIGAAIDFLVGKRLHAWRSGKDGAADKAVARVLEGFKRWGIWLIAANRFFPGIRAFFFVAAGMAGFSFWPVIALSVVSAILWNLVLVGMGVWIGAEYGRLSSIVGQYQIVVWVLMFVAATVGAIVILRRRKART